MKKNNKNRITMFFIATLLILSFAACGKEDTVTSVVEENASAEITSTEEPAEEVAPDATYVEVNELNYEENTKVTSKGILYVGEDISTLKVIDVDLELTNVVVEDAGDGTKTVTIEQSVEGYIWTDGNTFATNLHMPVLRLADSYSGQMISAGDKDAVTTEVKWKEDVYTISAFETTSWDDDDWSTGWYPDPSGDGERLNSRLDVKTVVSIDNAYDGLVLVLAPINDAKGNDGGFIMDLWTEDSRLFNVNDMNANFLAIADAEEVEKTETDETEVAESAEETVKEESKTEEAKLAETTATTAPKEEHTHSFTSTDTPSTCTVAGTRTFTCACGYSYSESLGLADHNYIESTITVHHDEEWSVMPRTETVKVAHCICGFTATNNEDFQNHRAASVAAGNLECGSRYWMVETQETVYDNVKTADAWDEIITTYTCSVCGQQQK